MTVFTEAAREAAARAMAWADSPDPGGHAPVEVYERLFSHALTATLNALPERSKAILALAELSDEELVERVAAAQFEAECGQPPAPVTRRMATWSERQRRAGVVLTALGIAADAREELYPTPGSNEVVPGANVHHSDESIEAFRSTALGLPVAEQEEAKP